MSRFLVLKGESGYNVGCANTLEEALTIAKELDSELSMPEWDNLDNHWVLDTETDMEYFPEY